MNRAEIEQRYIMRQAEPKGLTVAFFISAVFPDLGKALRGGLLVDGLFVWHNMASFLINLSFTV